MASAHNFCRIQLEETPRYENAPTTGAYEIASDTLDIPVQSVLLNPAPGHIDRSDEVRGTEGGPAQLIETYEPGGSLAMRAYMNPMTWLLECAGFEGSVQAGAGTNEVVSLAVTGGTPTSGKFNITWTPPGGVSAATADIPYNATADRVKLALEESFGRGNFDVTGGPLPGTPVVITAVGDYAATNVGVFTVTGSTLSAGTAAFTVTTPGAAGGVTDPDGQGVPTGAYLWTFTKRGGITAQSMQILLGYVTGVQDPLYLKGQGYGIQSLGMNADGALTADLVGLVVKRLLADPDVTPALDAASVYPARRGDLFVQWQEGVGTLQDFSFQIANPLVRQRTMSLARSSPFPDRLEHGDEKVRVSGSVPMHSISTTDFDTLMDARTFEALARWKIHESKVGTSGADYAMWLEMPAAQIVGGGTDPIANRRRFGGSFDFWASHDDVAGYDSKLYLVNGIDAIYTGIS